MITGSQPGDVVFDQHKVVAQAGYLFTCLARLVGGLINEQKLGVNHSPAVRLEIGNAVQLIMRTRADEQFQTGMQSSTQQPDSDIEGCGPVPAEGRGSEA